MHGVSTSPRPPLMEARGIRKVFATKGFLRATSRVVAAEDISFRIERGQALALVGESGSGKSTVARMLLRLEAPDGGTILLDGEDVRARETRRASLGYRSRIQMVFQDPFGSLNPVHTVAHHLIRPLRRHGIPAAEVRARALDLLGIVGLEPVSEFIDRHPYELSGGQRQRVAVARALAVAPDLLVADEPTSMLDVSIRMGILNLLARLKRERGLAILLITHDLASARYLADRILVLYRGRVVEDGPAGSIVGAPAHPYTRALLASIAGAAAPVPAPALTAAGADRSRPRVAGAEDPAGCPFASRCPEVRDLCRIEDPRPRPVDDRLVRCHLYPTTAPAVEARP